MLVEGGGEVQAASLPFFISLRVYLGESAPNQLFFTRMSVPHRPAPARILTRGESCRRLYVPWRPVFYCWEWPPGRR